MGRLAVSARKKALHVPEPSAVHAGSNASSDRDGNVEKRIRTNRRIWIDIDNSPHVPFFLPIIQELQNQGFELLLTARDMYQVSELLDLHHLPCRVLGRHYGKNKFLKVFANFARAVQLIPIAAKFRPGLAISHGSRAQVLTSKLLRIRSVMLHDYEHSVKTGFVEADWTLMPDIIPARAMSRKPERVLTYPGLKEDVYLPRFRPDPSILNRLGIAAEDLVVTLRPPATEAHYHKPESEILFDAAVARLARTPNVRAILLPRNARQEESLRKKWATVIESGVMVLPNGPVDGLSLIWFSDLVIGGGGTMNREAAALGVPVYSVFRGKLGAVDRYLAQQGRLTLLESAEDIETRLVLKRRDRPSDWDSSDRPAMRTILAAIQKLVESR